MSADRELFGGEQRATSVSQPYWDGLHVGRLLLQQCGNCGRYQHYPRRICRYCSSEDVQFAAASGVGRIFASTVVHRSNTPDMQAQAPYHVALVRTDEGPLIFALLDESLHQSAPITDREVVVDHDRTRENRLLTVRFGGTPTRPAART